MTTQQDRPATQQGWVVDGPLRGKIAHLDKWPGQARCGVRLDDPQPAPAGRRRCKRCAAMGAHDGNPFAERPVFP